MLRIALFVVLTLLAACGSGDVECEIDPAFSPALAHEIRAAGDAWNARARTKIVFVDAGEGEWLIVPARNPHGYFGYAMGRRKLIRLDPASAEVTYAVALHELGHALGLKHTKAGVMHPSSQATEFSHEDMIECERVGACEVP